MAMIIVLMGAQGAGKGTQAQKLSETFALPIIATGDILREVAKSDSPLGHQVRELQTAGQLVPDDILAEVVNRRTSQADARNGYILDGFPRTLPQVYLLDRIAQVQGHTIIVISINVPRDLLYKRLAGRRICNVCGAIYNIYFQPSAKAGVCDVCGNSLAVRADDNEEAIAKRLALYDEKTKPLLDHYAETKSLHTVDGTGAPADVFTRITEVIRGANPSS